MAWHIYIIGFFYTIFILVSLVGNGGFLVLFVLLRKVRQAVGMFILSLAVADLIFPLIVMPIHFDYLISGTWQRGTSLCQLRIFAYLVAASASVLSYCGVTVERYIRIIFPLRYRAVENAKCVFAAVALLWLYALSSSSFIFTDFLDESHHDTPPRGVCSHALPRRLFLTLFLLTYCVPLAVILFIYFHILQISRKQRRKIVPVNGNHHTPNKKARQSVMVLLLLFHFLVCWLPISVYTLVLKTNLASELSWPNWTWYQFLSLLTFLNSVLNPFIYGYSNSHFKAVLRNYISRRRSRVCSIATQPSAFVLRSQITSKQALETHS
ncbi:neuropeptide Y receptor type 1-like [Orbicella faveolata]|uniref:neuropeptide Y receptor type 1-like n=1 Tax=Orbicella faveolata TaxID=48498 RepID=UPI0009E1E9E5|nr:neuropeptide Y receptor type 1-like [Orbicella faveolata]